MTRGQLAIITPEGKILTSDEFNGDMFFDGHGKYAYERLDSIDHTEEYEDMIQEFSDEHFDYAEVKAHECDISFLDMVEDYNDKWRTEYVYIKNLSDKNMTMYDENDKHVALNADHTLVFYSGEFVADSLQDFETWSILEKQKNAIKEVIM